MFGYQRFKISTALHTSRRPAAANTATEMMLFLLFFTCGISSLLVLAGLADFNPLSKDIGCELSTFCGVGWSTDGSSRVRPACVTNLVDLDSGFDEVLLFSCCTGCCGGVIVSSKNTCWFGGVTT